MIDMAEKRCVFPGSFDPVTNGHLDLIRRSAALFDEVVVAVLHNPAKEGLFPVEKRLELLARACEDMDNVRVDSFEGLLVDDRRSQNARIVVRGLRGVRDFESECQMAQLNHQLSPEVETFFLATSPEHMHVSSSAVREIGMFGGDLSPYVPQSILQEVARILKPRTHC